MLKFSRHVFTSKPVALFLAGGAIYGLVQSTSPVSSLLVLAALGWAVCAFIAGRVQRSLSVWPHLAALRRPDYGNVWDALSVKPDNAARAATGLAGEEDLRASGLLVARRIADAVSLQPSDDVLEIGIGVGRIGWALAPLCRSWIGCDVSAHMLAHTKRRLAEFSNVRLIQLDRANLDPVADASVDVVYCSNALPHFDQPARFQYVLDAYRILRPGGRLYLDTIALDSPEGWVMVENNRAALKAGVPSAPYTPHASTPEELLAYLSKAGFSRIGYNIRDSLLEVVGVKTLQ